MNNRQVSRWVFTFNNYDSQLNIRQYLSTQSSIKRAIWGFETSAVGTKHLQGYIEFHRSVRFTFVKKIFPRAFWDPARGSSRQNFNYCSKGGHFDFIGDFSREQSGKTAATTKNIPMPVPLILRGLLNPVTAAQTKVSKEFSDKFNYYNYAVPFLTDIKERNELYDQWQNKLLYLWQFTVLRKLMGQNDREILWICDPEGNNGKSFLAHYLHALYDFTILDGVLSCKDLAHVLKGKPKGAAFDLARSNIRFVDYSVFESLKNGFLLSGKYKGKSMRFQPLRILVLANECPQKSQLSQDRWCVWTVGEGELSDMGKHAVVSPGEQFPFVRPEKYPNLEEDFDLRLFYSENGIKSSSDRTTNPTSTSQRAGTSRERLSETPLDSTSACEESKQDEMSFVRPSSSSVSLMQLSGLRRPTPNALVCPSHPNNALYKKGCPCRQKVKLPSRQNDLTFEDSQEISPGQEGNKRKISDIYDDDVSNTSP